MLKLIKDLTFIFSSENFVQKLTFAKDDPTVSTTLIPDVMKLIYLATTKSEVSLIVDLLHKCYGQRDTDEEVADGGNKYVIYISIY